VSSKAPWAAQSACAAALLVSQVTLASPSARLVYVRSSEAMQCPDETAFRKAVATRLGYDPFFPSATKTVVARIDRQPKGFGGHIQIVDNEGALRGERDLTVKGDHCAELVNSLALAVSVAIDDLDEPPPKAQEEPPQSPKPPPESPQPAKTIEPAPQAKPAPKTVAQPFPLEAAASIGPEFNLGTSPGLALGLRAAGTLLHRDWHLGLRAELQGELPVQSSLPNVAAPSARLTTQTFAAAALLCAQGRVPFACLGPAVTRLSSQTAGISSPKEDATLALVLLGRFGVALPISDRWFFAPSALLQFSPVPTTLEINGAPALRLPRLGGGISLQIGVNFR
jgi:hypothetical protein